MQGIVTKYSNFITMSASTTVLVFRSPLQHPQGLCYCRTTDQPPQINRRNRIARCQQYFLCFICFFLCPGGYVLLTQRAPQFGSVPGGPGNPRRQVHPMLRISWAQGFPPLLPQPATVTQKPHVFALFSAVMGLRRRYVRRMRYYIGITDKHGLAGQTWFPDKHGLRQLKH